jgi:hypothetical protein
MTYMTGSSKFKVDEVEIFRVNTFWNKNLLVRYPLLLTIEAIIHNFI